MHPRRRTITALAALSAACFCAQVSQPVDVEQVAGDVKKVLDDPLRLRGTVGASSAWYQSEGIAPRRDPFYWVFNANLSITLFSKITVPFTAVLTQQDKNFSNGLDRFSQPFNQFGISPRYRWLTVHAGYRSIDFSEYTLSGAIWLGGGVEVKPQRSLWSGAAFFGRFLKAVPEGGVEGITVSLPAYERWGGGARLRIGDETGFAQLHFTKITDDPLSIPFDTALPVTPQQNELVGFSGRRKLSELIAIDAEFDLSLYRKNLFSDGEEFRPHLSEVFSPQAEDQLSKVIRSGIELSPGRQIISLRYKRVDPDYRSLGSMFLTNDVEEVSVGSDLVSANDKVSGSIAVGLQRNNLDQKQILTARRVIGSLNLAWSPADFISISGNYSSFSSNSIARRDIFTDSIVFIQLTQSGALNVNFAFGGSLQQMVIACVSYQETGGSSQASTFGNASLSYSMRFAETGWSLVVSGICNRLYTEIGGSMFGFGPQTTVQRTMMRGRCRLSVSGALRDNLLNEKLLARNYTASAGFSLKVTSSQSLRVDGSWIMKEGRSSALNNFSETRGMLAYSYQFGASVKRSGRKK